MITVYQSPDILVNDANFTGRFEENHDCKVLGSLEARYVTHLRFGECLAAVRALHILPCDAAIQILIGHLVKPPGILVNGTASIAMQSAERLIRLAVFKIESTAFAIQHLDARVSAEIHYTQTCDPK